LAQAAAAQTSSAPAAATPRPPADMVLIEGGTYPPFTATVESGAKVEAKTTFAPVRVESFFLDRLLVTNERYLKFVESAPEWKRSQVKRLFADSHYLQNWKDDSHFPKGAAKRPVTDVSWFAANAYCESLGRRLPTTDEWEFAFYDKGRHQNELKEKILAWYGRPNRTALPPVGLAGANGYGVSDMTGLVWEWTEDFNGFLSAVDTRDNGGKESSFVCGNGSRLGNAGDYATFMRYSFRSSLKANYTTASLGFRCAKGL
jgi:formylglycine-generating enzyme required for sulfatase activity